MVSFEYNLVCFEFVIIDEFIRDVVLFIWILVLNYLCVFVCYEFKVVIECCFYFGYNIFICG